MEKQPHRLKVEQVQYSEMKESFPDILGLYWWETSFQKYKWEAKTQFYFFLPVFFKNKVYFKTKWLTFPFTIYPV